jgi:hypothetical protein
MHDDAGTASTVDETLRAIVAADRLALSEAGDAEGLLRRRLMLFYGCFAVLSGLAAIGGRVRGLPVPVEPHRLSLALTIQTAHALTIIATIAALGWWARAAWSLRVLDAVATVATAMTAAFGLSMVPQATTIDLSVVAIFLLFFTVRAALVPSKPWLAALVAAVSGIPVAIGLAILYRRVGIPDSATAAAVRIMLAGVAAVYVVSRTIYGLRRVVEQAVQLGQYVVHEKIGEGGMGAVYRASHAMLKRPTAVKLIAPGRASAAATARFEREVMAVSRLSHPNTVAIYDFGRTRGGVFYYAMELLDGRTLTRLVEDEGPLPVARAVAILAQLTAALAEAHDAGLVHRDVKPENVMLCTRGGIPDVVKVLDFGLVKDVATPDELKLTARASIAGTPLYMAPEAIVAPDSVGPPADLYAVGCVAHFLLTGRPPFPRNSVVEACAAHVHAVPAAPSQLVAEVPAALDALVLRCLEKDPALRPTARELGAALAELDVAGHPSLRATR